MFSVEWVEQHKEIPWLSILLHESVPCCLAGQAGQGLECIPRPLAYSVTFPQPTFFSNFNWLIKESNSQSDRSQGSSWKAISPAYINSQFLSIILYIGLYTYTKNLSVCIIVCESVLMCRHSYVIVHKWGWEDNQGCRSSSSTLSETGISVCCCVSQSR